MRDGGPAPFARGLRGATAREIDDADVVQSVLKVFKDPVPANVYSRRVPGLVGRRDARASVQSAVRVARSAHSVAFLPCAVICAASDGFELGTLEPYLPGDYTKHSDNAGHVETDDEVAKAFSWFTYVSSERLLVVYDLQGVNSFYTDPQIHTWDGEGFGLGNMGAEGSSSTWRRRRATCSSTSSGCRRSTPARRTRRWRGGCSAPRRGLRRRFSEF